jgi:monofunctional biosynthetic peptidoglycan transglycosylase
MKSVLVFTVLLSASVALVHAISTGNNGVPDKLYLIDFSSRNVIDKWSVVNDGVMGGLSKSRIRATGEKTAVFEGHLSLENNGGFASVRASLDGVDLSKFNGIAVRARGDGRAYQIRFRTDGRFDRISYRATFVTEPGQWQIVKVPFKDFEPTFRGRVLSGVEPLDTSHLRQIGLMAADKQEGSFRLEIDWVKPFALKQAEPDG